MEKTLGTFRTKKNTLSLEFGFESPRDKDENFLVSSEDFVLWRPTLQNSEVVIFPPFPSLQVIDRSSLELQSSCLNWNFGISRFWCLCHTDEELEATKFKLLGLCYTKENYSISGRFELSRFTCLSYYAQ